MIMNDIDDGQKQQYRMINVLFLLVNWFCNTSFLFDINKKKKDSIKTYFSINYKVQISSVNNKQKKNQNILEQNKVSFV
jgi:hypothetical protein